MQNILTKLENSLNNNDIFSMWKDELELRTSSRGCFNGNNISISKIDELDFLYRSWYFSGKKYDFLNILINNLQKIQVLKWLDNAPVFLLNDFWAYLPWYIYSKQPKPEKLHFIVYLYKPDNHEAIKTVINTLDFDSCEHLISKTANQDLRNLFKDRISSLNRDTKQAFYGFDKSQKSDTYPGIYGDKIENIFRAVSLMQESDVNNFNDPYCAERFMILLETCDNVLKCGMVEDCLLMLIDIYKDYQRKNRLVDLLEDEKIYRTFYRLLRKAIPIYVLLNQPLLASETAEKIYGKYFSFIKTDPAAIQYLSIFESIAAAFYEPNPSIMYEIYLKNNSLEKYRPHDIQFIRHRELNNCIEEKHLEVLIGAVDQKISALPHESFIVLEYIRMCFIINMLSINNIIASKMLDSYIMLWNWIPSNLFMNETIFSQIAPMADEANRSHAKQICDAINDNSCQDVKNEILTRPDLFKIKKAGLKREILSAYFLGVLK